MKFIDLHTHSTASDGTFTPTEVVNHAIEKDLAAIALTDHDTIAGVAEAMAAAEHTALRMIPGTELSCYYKIPLTEKELSMKEQGHEIRQKDVEIHIVGLFIDYKNATFQTALDELKNARNRRNLNMIELFQKDDIPMSMEKLNQGNPDTVVTRAHFARVLIEEGVAKTKEEVFKKYLGPGCKYYLPKPDVSPEYVISLINQAGGMAFLAHPLIYKLNYDQIETMVRTLIPAGLRGIEAYHSSVNGYEGDRLRSLAKKYDLLVSGGSDFHGANKPDIDLGCGRGNLKITEHILTQIDKARCAD